MHEQTGWDDLPAGISRVNRRRQRVTNTALGTIRRNGLTEAALRAQIPGAVDHVGPNGAMNDRAPR